jgi:Zona pellucida-like domain
MGRNLKHTQVPRGATDVIMVDHLIMGSCKAKVKYVFDCFKVAISSAIIRSDSTNEIPMPACHMKIYSNDKLAENVKIGDPLKLMINIDKQDSYGLHITDCLVRDGIGWGEQRLIDSDGCPLDQEILGPFSYDSDRTKATVAFPAHKFPYTSSVYYQCNVRLCSIEEENCHKVSLHSKLLRRSIVLLFLPDANMQRFAKNET